MIVKRVLDQGLCQFGCYFEYRRGLKHNHYDDAGSPEKTGTELVNKALLFMQGVSK